MKITDVITHQLSVPVDEPFTSSRGWVYKTKGALVVEVQTDEGITGWGDCYGPATVAKAVVDSLLRPSVIGCDPFDVEVIWETLYNKVKDYGLTGRRSPASPGSTSPSGTSWARPAASPCTSSSAVASAPGSRPMPPGSTSRT